MTKRLLDPQMRLTRVTIQYCGLSTYVVDGLGGDEAVDVRGEQVGKLDVALHVGLAAHVAADTGKNEGGW